ncbi:MAG: helix-turn-helix domain-containing protein [Cyclobacteriaceae bacterium]|nr:helix-turn-helix domain-containing protein [Cyclobacteriaceae bacterium]
MASAIITPEDLQQFKIDLLEEIRKIVLQRQTQPVRKWLKSHEVMRLLTVSPGTLQHLRVSGVLPYTKIGAVIFYDYDDIQKMIESHKSCKSLRAYKPSKNGLLTKALEKAGYTNHKPDSQKQVQP